MVENINDTETAQLATETKLGNNNRGNEYPAKKGK
jgi:hypothetical protein